MAVAWWGKVLVSLPEDDFNLKCQRVLRQDTKSHVAIGGTASTSDKSLPSGREPIRHVTRTHSQGAKAQEN